MVAVIFAVDEFDSDYLRMGSHGQTAPVTEQAAYVGAVIKSKVILQVSVKPGVGLKCA